MSKQNSKNNMDKIRHQFLVKLINEPGPSGFEDNVQNIYRNEVKPYCDEITTDSNGNVVATLNPGKDFSIMISGHADEIGLIVNYIDENGFIYVKSIGGIDPSILGSKRARILTGSGIIEGIFGQKSLHLEEGYKRKIPKMSEVYIDVGAKNKKDIEKLISVGDPIIFGENYRDLMNGYASARCFDNRIGVFIITEVLKTLKNRKLNITVHAVSTVQEETGIFGAGIIAYRLKPTMGIAIDAMPATDSPGISKTEFGDIKLNNGPVIRRGVKTSNRIAEKLIEVAKSKKIKYQIDIDTGNFGTDSDAISKVRSGVPVGGLEVPTRYLHSSEELLSLNDLDNCIKLLSEAILSIDKNKNFLDRI